MSSLPLTVLIPTAAVIAVVGIYFFWARRQQPAEQPK